MTKKTVPVRQNEIRRAALAVAAAHGYPFIIRDQVARAAGVAPSLLNHHFKTMQALRNDLVRFVVQETNRMGSNAPHDVLRVAGQALALRDPGALALTKTARAAILASL